MATLFQLPMQFGIPDLLYYEEIEPGSPGLEFLGLQIMEVSGDFVAYAQQLPGQHNHLLPAKNGPKPSHNDYLALALAKQEACTLLTGAPISDLLPTRSKSTSWAPLVCCAP